MERSKGGGIAPSFLVFDRSQSAVGGWIEVAEQKTVEVDGIASRAQRLEADGKTVERSADAVGAAIEDDVAGAPSPTAAAASLSIHFSTALLTPKVSAMSCP